MRRHAVRSDGDLHGPDVRHRCGVGDGADGGGGGAGDADGADGGGGELAGVEQGEFYGGDGGRAGGGPVGGRGV